MIPIYSILLYCMILHNDGNSLIAKCFKFFDYFIQDESTQYLLDSLTTIRNIETLTGVDFFSDLTVEQQDKIELTKASALWNT